MNTAGDVCGAKVTPSGQIYALDTIVGSNQKTEQVLWWKHDSTSFQAHFFSGVGQAYSKDTLDTFIDSFHPIKDKDAKIRHYDHSVI